MSEQGSDENWLVKDEPVVAQWLDKEAHRPRYLGFSSPSNWRSHLKLNLGLEVSSSKREALIWFRLPIRVKSKSAKRPTKFYLYFIIELDMFDVNGEDQGLSLSQPTVPPAVQFAFKGSNVCQSADDIIRLRFNLNRPGVVVMPKAEESPFEPSAVNQEVLLALKSLSEATTFSVYVHQKSVSKSQLETLCWMVHHGNLQSRPRGLDTLYHGKGGEVNAWQNFILLPGPDATAGASTAKASTESFFVQESISFADESEMPKRAPPASRPSSTEKQAMVAEVHDEAAVKTVEKTDQSKAAPQDEDQARERQGSIPPAYNEAVSTASPKITAAPATERPAVREARSFSLPPVDRVVPPGGTRQSSAPPSLRGPLEEHQAPSARRAGSKTPVMDEIPNEKAPPIYKRTKPPSDDEIEESEWEPAPPRTKGSDAPKARPKPKAIIKCKFPTTAHPPVPKLTFPPARPTKRVRFDTTHTSPPRSSRPDHNQTPSLPASSSSSTTPTMTATARDLPTPQSTLLRATIDWFKWAWLTNRAAHIPLTPQPLLALGHHARTGNAEAFYATRARCSAHVLWHQPADAASNRAPSLREELTRLLVWVASVDPAAEMGLVGELQELGRRGEGGRREGFEHGCAVVSGFVVFRYGRLEEGEEEEEEGEGSEGEGGVEV